MDLEDLALTDEEIDKTWDSRLLGDNLEQDIFVHCGSIAKAQRDKILSACYPCEECGGSGTKYTPNGTIRDEYRCPACKGTGKGSPMVAILAENQELPRPFFFNEHYTKALKDMTTPKDGYIWKKVKV